MKLEAPRREEGGREEEAMVTFCILVTAKKISMVAAPLTLLSDEGQGKALKDFLEKVDTLV